MESQIRQKRGASWIATILILSVGAMGGKICVGSETGARPRIIATTDGEIDDRCSMVRFLLYANEWDIEGIIISSSKFHWDGHQWAGVTWIDEQINQYAKCYDKLKQHADGFPTPEQLKSKQDH